MDVKREVTRSFVDVNEDLNLGRFPFAFSRLSKFPYEN
jgi:hypothetical protein